MRVLVTATNPDGARQPRQRPDRDRQGRAAGQHGPAGRHRRDPARHHAERVAGHLERPGAHAYAYQWQHDFGSGFTDIAGATGTTYPLGVADVGTRVRVRVTATNADASVSATSIGSSVVQAGPPVSTGRADDLRHRAAHRRR